MIQIKNYNKELISIAISVCGKVLKNNEATSKEDKRKKICGYLVGAIIVYNLLQS